MAIGRLSDLWNVAAYCPLFQRMQSLLPRGIAAFALTGMLLPFVAAFARTFDAVNLPYSDAPSDLPSRVAISFLTEEGVLEGNPDNTFRPESLLNRAEFVTIIMRLMPEDHDPAKTNCFPDVPVHAWYAAAVCRAKFLGIVEGNADLSIPKDRWGFAPDRTINYAEAVKVLTALFAIPLASQPGEAWYIPYLRAAEGRMLGLPLAPGSLITRRDMALLTAAYLAYARGELRLLRSAQGLDVPLSSAGNSRHSSVAREPSAPSSPAALSSSRSAWSSPSALLDPISDASLDARIVLLGSVSPILASVNVFSNAEPLMVTAIDVTLASGEESVASLLVYDHDRRLLGQAYRTGGASYRLQMKTKSLVVPYREEFSFYVRAQVLRLSEGGEAGELLAVSAVRVEGNGVWSNRSYTQSATGNFVTHQLARAAVTGIASVGPARDFLVGGSGMEMGRFRFVATTADDGAEVTVTDLTFTLSLIGGVTVTNVQLLADGMTDGMPCSTAGSTVTCSDIPPSFGALEDGPRTLRLLGDITVPPGASKASLQVSLNEAGSPFSAGAVRWTDGTSVYAWVGLDTPIARGTQYAY